ncbi:hypothetical protein SAY87_018150 [Trapa incisa]|uniref:Uncharacterized protein n=1 Tax=Trapa incisa TaxID=236973 RepID=A0AAN7QWR2_9MYRT|nr:hypothetical protein SAY87_018150 [Trapa incisa]
MRISFRWLEAFVMRDYSYTAESYQPLENRTQLPQVGLHLHHFTANSPRPRLEVGTVGGLEE